MDILIKVGSELGKIRRMQKISQTEVANFCGVDQSILPRWESGRCEISLINFINWCESLGLRPDEVVRELREE